MGTVVGIGGNWTISQGKLIFYTKKSRKTNAVVTRTNYLTS